MAYVIGDEQLWHELGHLLMAYVIGPDKVASILQSSSTRCNPHSPSIKVDAACAFLEGWGHYVTMVLKKSPVIFNLDYSKILVQFPTDQNEQLTARMLWNLGQKAGFTAMLQALYGPQSDARCPSQNLKAFAVNLLNVVPAEKVPELKKMIDSEITIDQGGFCAASYETY